MDREALALDNIKLAWLMAHRQSKKGSPYSYEELESLALEGLWNAARTYKPEIGAFSTYACSCMEHNIIRQYTMDRREKRTGDVVSLDERQLPGEFENDDSRMMFISSALPGPEETVIVAEREREIREALDGLPEREREVIVMRFGFEGPVTSWEEIGGRYGVTRQAAQQIGKRALERIRKTLERKKRQGAAI